MCVECAATICQAFPIATEDEQLSILWCATPFPAGSQEEIQDSAWRARSISADPDVVLAWADDENRRAMFGMTAKG